MQVNRWATMALIGCVLALSSCQRESVAAKDHPARIDSTEVKGVMRVTLEPRAAERIGLETAPVREEQVTLDGRVSTLKVVPYGAVMYDTKGNTWTFVSPEPLVFVRHPIVVEGVEGDRVFLSDGPPVGTVVVAVGAAELMGVENKYGH